MKIILEELEHQSIALKSIIDNFSGIEDEFSYRRDSKENYLIKNAFDEKFFIDVKMETGTGKTYVYTRLMYELHKLYGLNKFVIVVPSPAIKLGTKNFIESDYSKREFSKFYGNTSIELAVVNAGDFKLKSGRRNFPSYLSSFIEGTVYDSNTIHAMIINADMLKSQSMTRSDYDQTLFGGLTCPIDAIKKVKPIVIIDEPHKFPRDADKKNYQAIESIEPQIIFRFGATFPEKKVGKGKNAVMKKDYFQGIPQYELNAIESFNNGLVKGIDIYYPKLTEDETRNIFSVDKVTKAELVLKKGNKSWELKTGDPLSNVDEGFEGDIEYAGLKELSNGLALDVGMKLLPGTFRTTYQEIIIKNAIDKHFEIEIDNFLRENNKESNQPKIKTLSLFFIDQIKSYRDENGWLKETFEKLLRKKISGLITEFEYKTFPREKDYLSFLQASLKDLQQENQVIHAGYFGEDNSNKNEAIQNEVDDILKNKEKLISFKDEKDNWITRRFLFSKWTLREGWDNPNVFVIAKLRTSGSENSKIQEVGRGLRLPVDEFGRRVQFETMESRLAFLIGYDEKEFAKTLVGEINSDVKISFDTSILTDDMINVIVNSRISQKPEYNDEALLKELDDLELINRKNEFVESVLINGVSKSGYEWFCEFYPEIYEVQLRKDRVKELSTKKVNSAVKLKKENWDKIKDVWKEISNRHMIEFERIPNNIEIIVNDIFNYDELFKRETYNNVHEKLSKDSEEKKLVLQVREEAVEYNSFRDGLPYGYFIKLLHERTKLSVSMLHKHCIRILRDKYEGDDRYLSETTLKNIVGEFNKRFSETFAQMYQFKTLDFKASTNIFDAYTNSFVEEISTGLVGVNSSDNSIADDRFLYENPPVYFDSFDPEKYLLEYKYPKYVTIFGKLPKNSIKVPKYTGGSTTPDLVYVVETEKEKDIFLFVETKAKNMRVDDQEVIKIQREFFKLLKEYNVDYTEAITPNDVYHKLKKINEEE